VTEIPTDLVPLRVVASRLRLPTRELVSASERREFPQVYEPLPRRWRVSAAAVEEWLKTVTVESRAAVGRLRADWVKARSEERWRVHPQGGGARRAPD
jgi:hypothetical protein